METGRVQAHGKSLAIGVSFPCRKCGAKVDSNYCFHGPGA